MRDMLRKVGSWLFQIGIVLAVIVGIIYATNEAVLTDFNAIITGTLAALGFIVGILSFFAMGSIARDEVRTFLIAALVLVGIGATGAWFGQLEVVGPYFSWVAGMLAIFVAPAAGILAIRAIWDVGKSTEQTRGRPR